MDKREYEMLLTWHRAQIDYHQEQIDMLKKVYAGSLTVSEAEEVPEPPC